MTEDPASAEERVVRLERRLERERRRRREAERLAEVGTRRLYELNRDLDELVVQRTAEAEEALAAAERVLASRLELLRMIAHEVLTPMHQIEGLLELVETSRMAQDDSERVAASVDAAAHVAHLVRDVADLVATETGSLELAAVVCDPTSRLEGLMGHWRPMAARRGLLLVLESTLDPGLEVVTDLRRVRRVMDELLLSAVSAARTRVVVRARVQEAQGSPTTGGRSWLVLEVHDDGPGESGPHWTMEDLLGGEVGAGVPAGTVVGLLLAQRLVAALGGQSAVGTSDLGGAVRSLTLELVQPDGQPDSR